MNSAWRLRVSLGVMLLTLSTSRYVSTAAGQGAQRGARVQSIALVIGSNVPAEEGQASLRFADDDAVRTHELLREAGVFSQLLVRFDTETRALRPDYAVDGVPSMSDLERAFAVSEETLRRARSAGYKTEFMLFYSGHGDVEHGEGFLTLEDGRLTRSLLYERLKGLSTDRNHVVIDACRSYFMAYDRGAGGQRERYNGPLTLAATPAQLSNTGFILSTASNRESHEWERYEGGILSHELHSALRGAADADLNGKVTYVEIAAFLHQANRAIDNPRFRPEFMVRAPYSDPEKPLLRWPRDSQTIEVRTPGWGHFFIQSADGDRLLDANPAADQALALHLPSSRPLYVRRNDLGAERVIQSDGELEVAEPLPSWSQVAIRGPQVVALEKLFATPFGTADVSNYDVNASLHNLDLHLDRVAVDEPSRWYASPLLWVTVAAVVGGAALVTGVVIANQDDSPAMHGGSAGVTLGAGR